MNKGKATYIGNWKNNKINGKGKITYENNQWYEGEWVDGKKHG